MKRRIILIIVAVLVVLAALAAFGWYHCHRNRNMQQELIEQTSENEHPTDRFHYFFWGKGVPVADPRVVGKWQNAANPGWYKVYYDDYDEKEKLFWGKEWDESDDVYEEDLMYHGNGWFRWVKKGRYIHEYATMDIADVPIFREYKVKRLNKDSFVYFEPEYRKFIYRFARVEE